MGRLRRHPTEVTADRLDVEYESYYDYFTPDELNAIERVGVALREIASGERWAIVRGGAE
jgi:hypothetical protein